MTTYTDSDGAILTVRVKTDPAGNSTQTYSDSAGLHHRLDGPAKEVKSPAGEVLCQIWCLHGERHRLDRPAHEAWWPGGQLQMQNWYENGVYHRIDGPAKEQWWPSGQLSGRAWFVSDELHRLDGPAKEVWDENGEIFEQTWHVRGVKIEGDDDHLWEAIAPTTSPERLADLASLGGSEAGVANFAVANTKCPTAAKVFWALTQE